MKVRPTPKRSHLQVPAVLDSSGCRTRAEARETPVSSVKGSLLRNTNLEMEPSRPGFRHKAMATKMTSLVPTVFCYIPPSAWSCVSATSRQGFITLMLM